MLASTLILALLVGGPTAGDYDPGEAALSVPTYASPPYFPDHSQLNRTGRPVVVVKGPGSREVQHRCVRFNEPNGCSFEVRAIFDANTGETALRYDLIKAGRIAGPVFHVWLKLPWP